MSVYQEQFEKYTNLTIRPYNSYMELVEEVKKVMVNYPENIKANAIVLFGFSGNGKSTWISNFIKEYPNYTVVSMDAAGKRIRDRYGRDDTSPEIVEEFGNELESVCRNDNNVIIDGNFLNLLTRSALADTLKTFGYQVNVVDITDNSLSILKIRIMDVASERMGIKIDESNLRDYANNPEFQSIYEEIVNHYNMELASSNLNEQIMCNVKELGVNNFFNRNTPYEEIVSISQFHR